MRTLPIVVLILACAALSAQETPPAIEPSIVVSQAADGLHLAYRVVNKGSTPIRLPRTFSQLGPVRLTALSPAGVHFHDSSPTGLIEEFDVAPGATAIIEEAPIRVLMSSIKAFNDYGPAFGAKPGDVLVVRLTVLGVASAPLYLRFDPDKIRW